jgi:hypothetical protein
VAIDLGVSHGIDQELEPPHDSSFERYVDDHRG